MSLILSMSLALATMQGDPIENAREAYNKCMVTFTNSSLDEGVGGGAFARNAKDACAEQKADFVNAIVKAEVQYGSSQSEAKAYADEEVQMVVDTYSMQFGELKTTNARMVEQ